MRPRSTTVLILTLALAAVGAWADERASDSAPQAAPGADDADDAARERIEGDLQLVATRTDDDRVWCGNLPALAVSIRNRSTARAHHVVLPGDGSAEGWREPHVFWTVERLDLDGAWVEVQEHRFGRCGNFDREWRDEIIELGAGTSREITDWVRPLGRNYDLTRPGAVRMRANYAFSAGAGGRTVGGEDGKPDLGDMAGTPAFSLASAWVEFELVPALRVTITERAGLTAGESRPAGRLFAGRIENVSDEKLEIQPNQVTFELRFESDDGSTRVAARTDWQDEVRTSAVALEPGDHVPLLGQNSIVPIEPTVTGIAAGATNVTAVVRIHDHRGFAARSRALSITVGPAVE